MGDNSVQSDDTVRTVRIGSRKSRLAVIQTESVVTRLQEVYGQHKYAFTIKTMSTTGDNIHDIPLAKIGEKALFTRELEAELLDHRIDVIVHSLKDLPTTLPEGCVIAAVTKREHPSDAIVLKSGLHLDNPFDVLLDTTWGTIGTSSLRRIAQLKRLNPEIKIADMRGNLNTRLAKLDAQSSGYSALILASAGLKRLEFNDRISGQLWDDWFYAVGQGALAIETRAGDTATMDLLKPMIDLRATYECLAERTFMQQLEGGCSVPIGVRSSWNTGANDHNEDNRWLLTLEGIVLSVDGVQKVDNKITIDLDDKLVNANIDNSGCPFNYTGIAISQMTDHTVINRLRNSAIVGYELAQSLIESGAKHILNAIKH